MCSANAKIADSLAVVLPRYGESIGGGAETLVKALVENIAHPINGAKSSRVDKLEVWTTCARDHRTWENVYPAGVMVENGVTVRRFPVDSRDVDIFLNAEFAIRDGRPLTPDQQLDWLSESVNSQQLYAHISNHALDFDFILFAPYLFATSFWGSLICPEKSILVPCLHNEPYAYLEVFRHLFGRVRGLMFNAEPEAELALELYALPGLAQKSAVVGMGFEKHSKISDDLSGCETELVDVSGPFLLYSGRKEQGKNLDLLINYFEQFKRTYTESPLQLVIIGSGDISFIETLPSGVVDLGFVSEAAKAKLMKTALALCQPSVNESFSIVMMEAWLEETPVLVHADCAVTRDHVVKSGGGLYFANEGEFISVLDYLLGDTERCRQFGESGREYVEKEYCWEAVNGRLTTAFDKFRQSALGAGENTA